MAHLRKVRCSSVTPSEGVADSHVSPTPLEGVKSSRCLYRLCEVVLHLPAPLTPSEGVADPRVFPTPSEGVICLTFRRCVVLPRFRLTFRRCAEAEPPREPAVAAFLPTLCPFHLPKVCNFAAFSSHLPKVRRSGTPTRACCSCVSPSTMPVPPSGGVQFPRVFASPSEGAQKRSPHESLL